MLPSFDVNIDNSDDIHTTTKHMAPCQEQKCSLIHFALPSGGQYSHRLLFSLFEWSSFPQCAVESPNKETTDKLLCIGTI